MSNNYSSSFPFFVISSRFGIAQIIFSYWHGQARQIWQVTGVPRGGRWIQSKHLLISHVIANKLAGVLLGRQFICIIFALLAIYLLCKRLPIIVTLECFSKCHHIGIVYIFHCICEYICMWKSLTKISIFPIRNPTRVAHFVDPQSFVVASGKIQIPVIFSKKVIAFSSVRKKWREGPPKRSPLCQGSALSLPDICSWSFLVFKFRTRLLIFNWYCKAPI